MIRSSTLTVDVDDVDDRLGKIVLAVLQGVLAALSDRGARCSLSVMTIPDHEVVDEPPLPLAGAG